MDHSLKTLSDRLNYALRRLNISQTKLAKGINVKPQNIQFLCSSQTEKSKFTSEIAKFLGINFEWLATGKGSMLSEENMKQVAPQKHMPILTVEQIINWIATDALPDLNKHTQWEIAIPYASDKTFAFVLQDKAMWPRLDQGTLVAIEPLKKPQNNDFVFAYIKSQDAIVLRQLLIKENDSVLHSLNSDFYKDVILGARR